jgi:hypothetical protein
MDKQKMDDIIEKYVRSNAGGNEIVTGWCCVCQ